MDKDDEIKKLTREASTLRQRLAQLETAMEDIKAEARELRALKAAMIELLEKGGPNENE